MAKLLGWPPKNKGFLRFWGSSQVSFPPKSFLLLEYGCSKRKLLPVLTLPPVVSPLSLFQRLELRLFPPQSMLEVHPKGRAYAHLAFHLDLSSGILHNLFDNVEANAGTFHMGMQAFE